MDSTCFNESNSLYDQNQTNNESYSNYYSFNNSKEFYYNNDKNEINYCKPGIIFGFEENLKEGKIYKNFLDEEGEKENMTDLQNNYIINYLDKNDLEKYLCNEHNNKYDKYCIKCLKHSCEKCLNEEEHKDPDDIIQLKFEKDFITLLNNFLKKEIKKEKTEYKFHNMTLALCNTFQCCPHIENFISLKNAIKLILEIDNLFQYTKDDSQNEDLNRELLKEKMIVLELNLENKLNKKIVYCDCCNSSLEFIFLSENQIKIIGENADKTFDLDYCQKYIKTDIYKYNLRQFIKPEFDYKNMYCILHNNKKFSGYCIDCKKNRCDNCIVQFSEQNHTINNFQSPSFNIEKFIKYGYKFCRFINAIVNTINEYPNINSYKSLENAEKLLTGENNNLNEEKIIEENTIKIQEFSLLSKRKNKDNKNYFRNITKIKLETKNIRSLNYFTKLKDLSNLRKLNLRENCIDSIKWLLKCNFLNNLEKLDLSSNNLGDFNIKYFKKLFIEERLLNLEKLYLHNNKFESFSLFDFIQFPKLKILFLGFNYFRNNTNNKVDKNKKYNFSKLVGIGLNSVFLKDNIELIKNMNLVSLKNLYLQNNDIESLSFLNDMKITNNKLSTIFLTNNNLTEIDIEILLKYENLEKIIFDENNISKIINKEKINEFKLKDKEIEIDLRLNNIDKKTKDDLKRISNGLSNVNIKI